MPKSTFFTGPHRLADRHTAAVENRQRVLTRCVPITVTPAELARVVTEDGVDWWQATAFVEGLIQRAADDALARTLGIDNWTPPAP